MQEEDCQRRKLLVIAIKEDIGRGRLSENKIAGEKDSHKRR